MAVDMSMVSEGSYTPPHSSRAQRYSTKPAFRSLADLNYYLRAAVGPFDTSSFAHSEKTAEFFVPTLKPEAERESGPEGRTNL
jgi:hypothetical protein